MVDTLKYKDWSEVAKKDLHGAKILYEKASTHDKEFRKFIKDCALLNGYYIETRYPAEDPLIAEEEDVKDGFKFAEEIISFIDMSIQ
ncbi:HEPN domain-containing protein [Clostridium mobile]|uniref:HEPN domain-containing protein n=1 Tax=Clostridium mobile TaxID=2841512 RepID=UPI001FEA47A9|nr:HEPN domain-containing protein [Clostridium mobile]